ncbi:unnamed protein product, partial [Amoebophrya sp. A25]
SGGRSGRVRFSSDSNAKHENLYSMLQQPPLDEGASASQQSWQDLEDVLTIVQQTLSNLLVDSPDDPVSQELSARELLRVLKKATEGTKASTAGRDAGGASIDAFDLLTLSPETVSDIADGLFPRKAAVGTTGASSTRKAAACVDVGPPHYNAIRGTTDRLDDIIDRYEKLVSTEEENSHTVSSTSYLFERPSRAQVQYEDQEQRDREEDAGAKEKDGATFLFSSEPDRGEEPEQADLSAGGLSLVDDVLGEFEQDVKTVNAGDGPTAVEDQGQNSSSSSSPPRRKYTSPGSHAAHAWDRARQAVLSEETSNLVRLKVQPKRFATPRSELFSITDLLAKLVKMAVGGSSSSSSGGRTTAREPQVEQARLSSPRVVVQQVVVDHQPSSI